MRIFFDELLIGFDFNNFLIAIAVITIIYLAWESTNVREDRLLPTAVYIIENNRRRLLDSIVRDSNNINRIQETNNQLGDSTSTTSNQPTASGSSTIEGVSIPEPPASLQSIIDEVSDLATVRQQNNESTYRALETLEQDINEMLDETNSGPQRIITDMDSSDTAEGIRRRRLAFYSQETPTNGGESSSSANIIQQAGGDNTDNAAHAENCSNENNENENISKTENSRMQHVAAAATASCSSVATSESIHTCSSENDKEEFRIKLKYLNDDVRLVSGRPSEVIGDFKKKNFTVELAAQKLVRLVFNGHVLQPDSKTLQACGLFDNCVVHCLVHNKKVQQSDNASTERQQQQTQSDANHIGNNQGGVGEEGNGDSRTGTFPDRNSSNGPLFVYFGIAAVTLAVIICWFCRIQYSYLFSWYSTIGLILMTVLFLITLPLIILIEREVIT